MREKRDMEKFLRAEIQDVLLQQFAFYVKHNAVAFSSYRARESCIQTNLTRGKKILSEPF